MGPGHSRWYLIETIESFNGQRDYQITGQGNFIQWFSANAFAGTNYASTPVGAVSHVDEPGEYGVNDSDALFGTWQAGKYFSISAWNSQITVHFQAVGDPLATK